MVHQHPCSILCHPVMDMLSDSKVLMKMKLTIQMTTTDPEEAKLSLLINLVQNN